MFLSSQHSFEMKSGEFAAYRLIFEPQEVAEVEIAIAQRHGGVTLLEVAPRRADLVPHLQFRPIWKLLLIQICILSECFKLVWGFFICTKMDISISCVTGVSVKAIHQG